MASFSSNSIPELSFRHLRHHQSPRWSFSKPWRNQRANAWWDFFKDDSGESPGESSGDTGDENDPQSSSEPSETDKTSSNQGNQPNPGSSPYWPFIPPRERLNLIGGPDEDVDAMIADDNLFRTWLLRRSARLDVRDARETGQNAATEGWEDWLDESQGWGSPGSNPGGSDSGPGVGMKDVDLGGWYEPQGGWEQGGVPRKPPKLPERGMSKSFKDVVFKLFMKQDEVEEELSFEDRVFQYTSQTTARFVLCLFFFPWLTGLATHDFILVPFIERWCEKTPLIAQLLDVRERQKLQMIDTLKLERQRVRFEAEIGKAPPLTDRELAEHMHEEGLHLREEIRAENVSAFANIWADASAALTGFLICVLSPKQVSIMRLTGQRIFTNISDTGKAFTIILCTDIFLGYHSEKGWETVIEMFLEHYGIQAEQNSIYIFVATVPVTLDVFFKLWVFKYLTRLSPSAAATLKEMKRH